MAGQALPELLFYRNHVHCSLCGLVYGLLTPSVSIGAPEAVFNAGKGSSRTASSGLRSLRLVLAWKPRPSALFPAATDPRSM